MSEFEKKVKIIVTDKDGIVKSVSSNNGDLDSSLIGAKWYDAFSIPKEYPKAEDNYPKVFCLPETEQKILVCPSYCEKGDISGFHILVENTGDEENSAQFMNKMLCLGKVVPGIAHEISNPLTYVSGWLQMFLLEVHDNDPRKETYKTLVKEFERIAKLVNNLLEFTRQTPTSKKIFDVNQVIKDVVFMVGYTLKNENIEVIKNLLPSELKIAGDSNRLKQVFLNFLQNAREAMPNGGKIFLSTNIIHNDSIIIQIRDTGYGISKDQLNKIFCQSYSTKSNGKSTGLGLCVCKTIIEELGGTIDLDSNVGEGTVVTTILPSSSMS